MSKKPSIPASPEFVVLMGRQLAAPTNVTPEPPVGWAPGESPLRGRLAALTTEKAALAQASRELESPETASVLGPKGVSGLEASSSFELASQWVTEHARAKRWFEYVTEQMRRSLVIAADYRAAIEPPFEYAMTRDPQMAERYPQLKALFDARKDVHARIGARLVRHHKEKNKKATPVSAESQIKATPKTHLN
jgi:hypothetical protein